MGYCMSMEKSSFFVKTEYVGRILKELTKNGFSFEQNDDGDIIKIYFDGEKLFKQDEMFARIAPFVKDGSFVEMCGEDGHLWRWVIKNGECRKIDSVITWPQADEDVATRNSK